MPFLAELDGETVVPEQVPDGETATCHDCGSLVAPRSSYYREGDTFVARHFWHPSGQPQGCEAGGESAQHERMKSVAASKARERWPDADVSLEVAVGDRRADVLVTFDGADDRLGDGLAIEVQYRNKGKDLEATEADFHDRGYSVLWLREQQYDGKNVHFDNGEWSVWWATAVPSKNEWEGFNGVIKWLRWVRGQNPTVKMDVKLPKEALKQLVEKMTVTISNGNLEKWISLDHGKIVIGKYNSADDSREAFALPIGKKWNALEKFAHRFEKDANNIGVDQKNGDWTHLYGVNLPGHGGLESKTAPDGQLCIRLGHTGVPSPNGVTMTIQKPKKFSEALREIASIQKTRVSNRPTKKKLL